jgi:flagellar hook-length control protein FliK
VREHFEAELKDALREQGIDLRDRALTIESARQQLFNVEQLERQQAAFNERLT